MLLDLTKATRISEVNRPSGCHSGGIWKQCTAQVRGGEMVRPAGSLVELLSDGGVIGGERGMGVSSLVHQESNREGFVTVNRQGEHGSG
jgi:hypothetical protein